MNASNFSSVSTARAESGDAQAQPGLGQATPSGKTRTTVTGWVWFKKSCRARQRNAEIETVLGFTERVRGLPQMTTSAFYGSINAAEDGQHTGTLDSWERITGMAAC